MAYSPPWLDVASRQLERDQPPLVITAPVFDLLVAIGRSRDLVVSKAELMEQEWSDVVVDEHNLTKSVFLLISHGDGDCFRGTRIAVN